MKNNYKSIASLLLLLFMPFLGYAGALSKVAMAIMLGGDGKKVCKRLKKVKFNRTFRFQDRSQKTTGTTSEVVIDKADFETPFGRRCAKNPPV